MKRPWLCRLIGHDRIVLTSPRGTIRWIRCRRCDYLLTEKVR